jgi:hypothetical protein
MNNDSGVIRDAKVLQDEVLSSQSAENILRLVEGQLLKFKEHYSALSGDLSGINKEEDLEKIANCIPRLNFAASIISKQIGEYDSIKNDLLKRGVSEEKFDTIGDHMKQTLLLLDAYIKGVKNITQNLTEDVISAKQAKEILSGRIKSIEDRYIAFCNSNNLHLSELKGLIGQIGRN